MRSDWKRSSLHDGNLILEWTGFHWGCCCPCIFGNFFKWLFVLNCLLFDLKNTLLESVLSNSTKYGIIKTPTILINDAPLLWPLSPKTVLDTLCFGFDHGMAPHVCYECATCGDPIACASRKPMKCKAHDGEEKENPIFSVGTNQA